MTAPARPRAPTTMLQAAAALGTLLDHRTRRRFALCIGASVGIALIEIAGLLAIVPLLTILATGEIPSSGISARIVEWTGSTDVDTVVLILTAFAFGCFVLRAIATLAVRWWILGQIFENEATTSARLLRRYLSVPYVFHLRTNSTQLLRTLTVSVDQTYTKVVVGLLTIATELIVAVATVLVLAVNQPIAAIALLCYFALVHAVITRLVSARSQRIGARFQQHNADVLKEASQAFGAIKHIQLGGHQDHFVARLDDVRRRTADTKRKNQWLSEVPRQYFELAFVVGIGLMIVAVAIVQGSDSIVTAVGLFAVAGFRLLPGLVKISNSSQTLHSGLGAMTLVLDAQELTPVAPDTTVVEPSALLRDALVLRDLSFRYPGAATDALHGIDLQVRRGESVAVVGPSGAGKSTLIDVMLGFLAPTGGELRVDQWPLADVRSAWQRGIGLVPQDMYLLDATIAENIAFGHAVDGLDGGRILEAVEMAQLADLIAELPDGLGTVVGERGVRLSGGQRQRLGIARALYGRPRVLVLDEATSALDSVTESKISATLRGLHGHLTMITIAHRLSTVRDADRLVVLDAGRVAAEGPFELLRERNDYFRDLVDVARS